MSAIRQSPPSDGPAHDGKVIGKDAVTYIYHQVRGTLHLVPTWLLIFSSFAPLANSNPILLDRHRSRKCGLPSLSSSPWQGMDLRNLVGARVN